MKTEKLEIRKTIEIATTIAVAVVHEVTAKKYAQATGLSIDRVIDYCNNGNLKARRVNAKGLLDRKGLWMIEAKQKISISDTK